MTAVALFKLVNPKVKDSGGAQAPHPRFSYQIWQRTDKTSLKQPRYPKSEKREYLDAQQLFLTRVKTPGTSVLVVLFLLPHK